MKCKKCGKRIKENTDGNLLYCQGHDAFEPEPKKSFYVDFSCWVVPAKDRYEAERKVREYVRKNRCCPDICSIEDTQDEEIEAGEGDWETLEAGCEHNVARALDCLECKEKSVACDEVVCCDCGASVKACDYKYFQKTNIYRKKV